MDAVLHFHFQLVIADVSSFIASDAPENMIQFLEFCLPQL